MTASIINKTIKSIVAASAALIMAASVAACGPNAATPSEENNASNGGATTSKVTARSLDEIKKSGVLKVAVFSDKAPFGYIDKDGKNAGYDIVFAERLAKNLGVKVKYTSVDPAARVDVLTSNKVDITLANFTVTDERKEKVDFAKPYMKVALGVVSPENAEITDVSQLKGKTLIIAKGTTAESYFEKNEPDVKLQKYDQYADAYNALLDGRGDAFSTDNTEVLAYDGVTTYTCPIKARNLSGRTGRGDTTFAGYISERQRAGVEEALRYCTALVSLKMETPGPFQGTRQDVLDYIREFY